MKTLDPLSDYSDDDLKKALKAREEKRRQDSRDAHAAYVAKVLLFINRQGVDALAPEHQRTSCSDSNRANSWGSAQNESARCVRCALLETMDHCHIPYPFRFRVDIESCS